MIVVVDDNGGMWDWVYIVVIDVGVVGIGWVVGIGLG